MEGEKVDNPPAQEKPEGQDKKTHKKGQKKEKKEFKSEYVFDADAINIDTEIPPLPKKTQILKKPLMEEFKEKQKKNREKIQKFIDQKKQIRNQNFKASKIAKKGEEGKHGQFGKEIEEAKQLRQRLAIVKKQRNEKRDKLHDLIQQAKKVNQTLKELGGATKGSKQNVLQKLQDLEHQLMTATLTKQQQKNLNNEITVLKRKIKDAESVGNIEFKLAQAEDRKQQLDTQIEQIKQDKEPLQKQFKQIMAELDKKNAQIDGLKSQLDQNNKQRTTERQKQNAQWEKWKEDKKRRLDQIEEKIKKTHQENDKQWEEFNQKKEEYWKQKNYIDWIEWQMKVKTRKVNDKERERKRLMYEEKEKEREKEEQLQKYIGQIELCNYLITYLKNIQQDQNKSKASNEQQNKEPVDISAKLAGDSQWKKEKGFEVIKSKKCQDQDQAPKKNKKNKKKNVETEETKPFNIPYGIQNQFETLKILAPSSFDEIEKKIEELKDRQKLFERGCQPQEAVAEEDAKLLSEIKGGNKPAPQKATVKVEVSKKIQSEDEFPTI